MNAFILIAIIFTGTPLFAEDITTLSGTKYKNITITRVEPGGISISHDDGLAKIPFTDMAEDLRTKYGYDSKKAAQSMQADQAVAAQRAAAANAAAIQQAKARVEEAAPKYEVVLLVDQKVEGGLLLSRSNYSYPQANAEIVRKLLAYRKAIPKNEYHSADETYLVRGGQMHVFLRGYPHQDKLVDGDTVCGLAVEDGVISIGGSTYHALRWIPIPGPR